MKIFGYVVLGILILALLLSLCFGLTWLGIEWYGFFGPKREAVRREVFKQTRSYNEGKTQQLSKLKIEYGSADAEKKQALAGTIRHLFADYDETLLPPYLRTFLMKIRSGN